MPKYKGHASARTLVFVLTLVLLLGPRVLLLRLLACCASSVLLPLRLPTCFTPCLLLGPRCCCCACKREHVHGARSAACETEGGSTTRVDPAACCTVGVTPGGAGVPGFASIWCWPALALCMRFDPGVFGHVGTDHPLPACPTLGASMTEIGNAGWVRAAHTCP
jgi:hypothetical protein